MVLILVIAGVVAPAASTFFPGLKIQKGAEGLVATFRKAHDDAVLTIRRHRVQFVTAPQDGGAPRYYLSFEPDPLRRPGMFRPLTGGWGRPEELPEEVVFETLEGAIDDAKAQEKYLEFTPDGVVTAGTITLRNEKDERLQVRVDEEGRVFVEEPAP